MSQFSTRTSWDSTESSYAAAVREARSSGRRIYDLTLSNPTRCGFSYNAEALLSPLVDPRALIYDPDPSGMGLAREAIADYYADHKAKVSVDDIVVTTSTSESYSFLFRLLCNPGDEILVAQPSYPLFDFLADLDDVRLRPYPLFYDHGWWIDMAELKRAITSHTRAILVVHPNNPTGHWTGAREREQLEELCVRHGLALIVDEVFLDYPLRETPQAPPRSFATGSHPALTFVLSGLSKIVGLPQMKAAWIATLGPELLRTEALTRLEIIADTFLSMNAPVQLALPTWLATRASIQTQILDRARANLATLQRISKDSPDRLRLLELDAGWSAVLSLPRCVGEADCVERLARERGVLLHPGSFYAMAESNRMVVSLIGPTVNFEEGIKRAID
ncbi:MAG: pyridoxal phosphate-dependent aminotransferase [Acidobacteriaceae bacterium]|nr:pyridoxal phosphate-dependent aminotransferase [Acidobacteriaceae bacterium]